MNHVGLLLWQTACHCSTLGLSTAGLQDHISLTQTRPCLLAARSLQHSFELSGRPSEGAEEEEEDKLAQTKAQSADPWSQLKPEDWYHQLLAPTASQADLFQADPEGRLPGDDSDVNGDGAHLFSQDILHIVTWELKQAVHQNTNTTSLFVYDLLRLFLGCQLLKLYRVSVKSHYN